MAVRNPASTGACEPVPGSSRLDDGGTGRKGEPAEERDKQLPLELTNPGWHGLEDRWTDAGGIWNRIECRERTEGSCMDISLPHKVASTVGDVELVSDEFQMVRIRSPDVVQPGSGLGM